MKLSTRTKRVLAFAGIWGGIGLLLVLFATFTKVIAAILMIACGAMLLIMTWQFVATYINE